MPFESFITTFLDCFEALGCLFSDNKEGEFCTSRGKRIKIICTAYGTGINYWHFCNVSRTPILCVMHGFVLLKRVKLVFPWKYILNVLFGQRKSKTLLPFFFKVLRCQFSKWYIALKTIKLTFYEVDMPQSMKFLNITLSRLFTKIYRNFIKHMQCLNSAVLR